MLNSEPQKGKIIKPTKDTYFNYLWCGDHRYLLQKKEKVNDEWVSTDTGWLFSSSDYFGGTDCLIYIPSISDYRTEKGLMILQDKGDYYYSAWVIKNNEPTFSVDGWVLCQTCLNSTKQMDEEECEACKSCG